MKTAFSKYHGLGNDFVVVDRRTGGSPVRPEQGVALCDRRTGIGADGVLTLLAEPDGTPRMHVTNADGSVAEMCGNGLRCVVKFLADEGAARGERLSVMTGNGLLSCELHRDAQGVVTEVTVAMGRPELTPSKIPIAAPGDRFVQGELTVGAEKVRGTAVSMGNPHFVLFGDLRPRAAELGPLLERHPAFPSRTNVEFVTRTPEGLDVVVWERGCGFTQACGTGACASVVAGILEGRLTAGAAIPVKLAGGTLQIRVLPDLSQVFMRGPAIRVFAGEVELA